MTSNFLKDKINEMHERIGKNKYRRETPDGVILGDPSAKNGVTFNLSDNFINAESYIKPSKNKDCEYKFKFRNDAECCRLMPISDPESKELLGFLACDVIPDEYCKKLRNLKTKNEESLGKINAETKVPHPLMLDEVSASFISYIRTNFWEKLGKEYGGYKIGRILSFILCVLNEKIEDSTAATIKVDVPLYEQCSTVSCKCGGNCKHVKETTKNKNDEIDELKREIFFKNYFLSQIKIITQEPICEPANPRELKNIIKTRLDSLYSIAQKGYEWGKTPEQDEEKFCLYCKEKDGTINHDVFIQINDVELGPGYVCKECFLESCKETQELLEEREEELDKATSSLREIRNLICNPSGAKTEMELMKNQHERINKIYKLALEGLGDEEVLACE